MRVLVTWGSKHGGTEGIGEMVAEALKEHGFEVVAAPAERVDRIEGVDAAIVGGALYANRWPSSVRRFVHRHLDELHDIPVWLFSSGPLDDSAAEQDIPPPPKVRVLAERIGAKSHVTFGGRLEPDARGFPAAAMAQTMSGDWRSSERIRAWADELASELPVSKPGEPIEHAARSVPRLVGHGVLGWALCAATMGVLLSVASVGVALAVHAFAAPLFFVAVSWLYFRSPGSCDPLPTAITWTALVAALDAVVVAGLVVGSWEMFTSVVGTWLPFGLIFSATWATGAASSMMPEHGEGHGAVTSRM